MDPNKVLAELIDFAVDGDIEGLSACSDDLIVWLSKGGAKPADPRPTEQTIRVARESRKQAYDMGYDNGWHEGYQEGRLDA